MQENLDLKKKAVRGGVVTISAQFVVIVVQLASIIVLSRLLPPEDFGVIAMITAITAFVGLFRDMGLSTASIQKGNLTFEQTNALFWLNTAAGAFLTILVMVLSPAIAWFYKRPELVGVTILLSTTFLFSSLGAQHAALLQRELRFKPKAVADVLGALTTLIISVVLALNGERFWSLAWGTTIGALITSGLYFFLSGFRPGLPRKADGVRQLLGFGANITAFELVNYFSRNLDSILIGRVWGAVQLGFYSRAYQMMMLPISSLRTPINAVAFPILAKLQHDPEEFRRYYCRITSLLAFLSMPLMAFLTVNAKHVVDVALGKQWAAVAPIFMILGLNGFIQPVASLRGLVMLSLGKSRRYLAWGIINAAAVCISFGIGVIWGAVGVAIGYLAVNYVILYPSMFFIFNDTPLKPSDFMAAIAVPLQGSAAALLVNLVCLHVIKFDSSLISLVANGIIFVTTFFVTCMLIPSGKGTLKSYLSIVKGLRN